MKKKIAMAKIQIKIKTPTTVEVITENDQSVIHYISLPEDLEATLMIAEACGWKVKYKDKYIVE